MSGNSKQRRVERHGRELLELGRRAKADLDAHAAELASLRAAHESELERLRAEHAAELDRWARAAREDADTIAAARSMLGVETERRQRLQAELDEIKRGGLLTRSEHEAAVMQETARLRDRLRRATEERLAPKKILIDHTQEERRLRNALARQRANVRGILAASAGVNSGIHSDALRAAGERCIVEIDGVLGDGGGAS